MCPLWKSCGTGGGVGLTPLALVKIGINLSNSGVEGWGLWREQLRGAAIVD